MKKLSTLLAIATFATTLGLAGCKNKSGDSAQPAAEKATEKPADQTAPAATTPAPATDQAKPADQAAATAPGGAAAPAATPAAPAGAAPAAAGDLPKDCQDYKADIEKLSTCDKLPQQTRDSLKQAYDTASKSWESLTPEAKANLASACKAGAQAVEQSAKATCGW